MYKTDINIQNVNKRFNYSHSVTYIKLGISFEFVEAGVEEAQNRQALEQALVIDEGQHPSNYWC